MTDIERILEIKITCATGTSRHILIRALAEIRRLRTELSRRMQSNTEIITETTA